MKYEYNETTNTDLTIDIEEGLFESGEQDAVNLYVGGYYLASVNVEDISDEALFELGITVKGGR